MLAYAGAGRTTSRLLGDGLFPLLKAPELGERLDGTPYSRDGRARCPQPLRQGVGRPRGGAPGAGERRGGGDPALPLPRGTARGRALRALNLPYVPVAVSWRYDPSRASGGVPWPAPHVEGLNGQQIAVENVMIQYAQIFTAQGVEPDAPGSGAGHRAAGENTVRLFHSGQMFEGVWSKEHDRAKTEYRLPDGTAMPFKQGKVWIHILCPRAAD